jgi:hypothetical protein
LGLGTFFLFGDSDKETSPFRGFVIISDIYVMAIYHFYKGGKKTFYLGCRAFGAKHSSRLWRKAQLTP